MRRSSEHYDPAGQAFYNARDYYVLIDEFVVYMIELTNDSIEFHYTMTGVK